MSASSSGPRPVSKTRSRLLTAYIAAVVLTGAGSAGVRDSTGRVPPAAPVRRAAAGVDDDRGDEDSPAAVEWAGHPLDVLLHRLPQPRPAGAARGDAGGRRQRGDAVDDDAEVGHFGATDAVQQRHLDHHRPGRRARGLAARAASTSPPASPPSASRRRAAPRRSSSATAGWSPPWWRCLAAGRSAPPGARTSCGRGRPASSPPAPRPLPPRR